MYDFNKIEDDVSKFWEKNKIYEKFKEKNVKEFYFLDGPPYTTGKIHVGHAWNKAMKDFFIRTKTMKGFKVLDQPGFDMHGLPIEVQVEKDLGIKDKKEIINEVGLKKFIELCRKFALDQMRPMIEDFKKIGIWMDWDNPYMTIKNSYIEGVWWALKKANDNGFLYKGKKSLTWCPRCATALAKHELEYENVTDDSIFVKFKVKGKENEYLIIWTTTPWTIAFNLAVMVNPSLDYVKANVGGEVWIVAKALAASVIQAVANKKFEVMEEFKGEKLKGLEYEHPWAKRITKLGKLKEKYPNVFTVVLSTEYVDVSSGTGLVHCAPGCGPEDFEIGRKNGLPAFNEIDDNGYFPEDFGEFSGLRARTNDNKFIEVLKKDGVLIETTRVEHEYAHCWRCHTGVVFRATDQWFLAVGKLRDDMLKENEKIVWVPDWAGNRWFKSWLTNLQDWCISRQRFWGVPLPIWECECGNRILIESQNELKEKTGVELEDLHRPWIDEVKIKCDKCGKDTSRIEDVLDVWLDSGASPWATMGYPTDKRYEKFWAADFILEGKDQIRGWFNSLLSLSMVSMKKASYKAVYMHGFIQDAQGRKMSKSLKNIISPYEVLEGYGADTMRYYMIGGSKPGLDINYNFEDMKIKYRNLSVLWNLHKFLIDQCKYLRLNPKEIDKIDLSLESRYILSKLNSNIKKINELFENYHLDLIPDFIEEIFLELSRSYIQLIREKLNYGNDEDKLEIVSVIYTVLMGVLKLFAPIAPFITESIYHNLKDEFKLKMESIHLFDYPQERSKMINNDIEKSFELMKVVIQEILSKRGDIGFGIRWPLPKAVITVEEPDKVKRMMELIKIQTNIKEIDVKGGKFNVELDKNLTKGLEQEGYSREVMRRIQNMRKKEKLVKENEIELFIDSDYDLSNFKKEIMKKVGAVSLVFGESKGSKKSLEKIKGKEFDISFNIVN